MQQALGPPLDLLVLTDLACTPALRARVGRRGLAHQQSSVGCGVVLDLGEHMASVS